MSNRKFEPLYGNEPPFWAQCLFAAVFGGVLGIAVVVLFNLMVGI